MEISIGRIGDKLVDSVANFTDVLREGPEEPYYFGLTTPAGRRRGRRNGLTLYNIQHNTKFILHTCNTETLTLTYVNDKNIEVGR